MDTTEAGSCADAGENKHKIRTRIAAVFFMPFIITKNRLTPQRKAGCVLILYFSAA
jgi:hypothetical protein